MQRYELRCALGSAELPRAVRAPAGLRWKEQPQPSELSLQLAQGVVVWCSFLMFSVLLYGNFFPPPLPQCYVEGNETLHQLILLAGGKQNWGRKAEKSKLAVTKKKKKKVRKDHFSLQNTVVVLRFPEDESLSQQKGVCASGDE